MRRVPVILLIYFTFTSAIGCQQEPAKSPVPAQKTPRAVSVQLTALVIDDPPLAAGLKLLRGEWAQRSGGQLDLQEWTVEELLAATEIPADIIIYPSRHVGTLVDRDWLRPLRNSVLRNTDLAIDDILPLVRNATHRYGNQIYGLSLGEPPLLLAIRLDRSLDEPLNAVLPVSWETATLGPHTENSALEHPLAAELLARGIAFAQDRSQSADVFEVDSMQPRIVSPPFIRALEQMLENNRQAASRPDQLLSLSWPAATLPADSKNVASKPTVFAPLPRAGQTYDPLREIWEDNDVKQSLVCLGFAGRSASVTRTTRNSASAFKLLTWMISESIATQLSPRSAATIWSRNSQVAKADKWLAGIEVGDDTAAVVTRQLSSDRYYLLPRIPGIDVYLQLLDDAVSAAISDGLPAERTLGKVAEQWNALTDRYDRNRQRVAYRKHLGISEN